MKRLIVSDTQAVLLAYCECGCGEQTNADSIEAGGLVADGLSHSEVARLFGVSRSYVSRILRSPPIRWKKGHWRDTRRESPWHWCECGAPLSNKQRVCGRRDCQDSRWFNDHMTMYSADEQEALKDARGKSELKRLIDEQANDLAHPDRATWEASNLTSLDETFVSPDGQSGSLMDVTPQDTSREKSALDSYYELLTDVVLFGHKARELGRDPRHYVAERLKVSLDTVLMYERDIDKMRRRRYLSREVQGTFVAPLPVEVSEVSDYRVYERASGP